MLGCQVDLSRKVNLTVIWEFSICLLGSILHPSSPSMVLRVVAILNDSMDSLAPD